MPDLRTQFGQIDIYLFDQLLRGRIRHEMRVLEAGCGSGRNLLYLLQAGYDVAAVDSDSEGVARVRTAARQLAAHTDAAPRLSRLQAWARERGVPLD